MQKQSSKGIPQKTFEKHRKVIKQKRLQDVTKTLYKTFEIHARKTTLPKQKQMILCGKHAKTMLERHQQKTFENKGESTNGKGWEMVFERYGSLAFQRSEKHGKTFERLNENALQNV